MLKYQLNTKFIRNDLVPIELSNYSINELSGDEFKDKLLLSCYLDEEITFDTDARIMAMYEQYMVNDDFVSSTAYDFNTVFNPSGVNKENRSFTLIFEKYFDLSVQKTEIVEEEAPQSDEESEEQQTLKWWYIWFNGSHLFDVSDGKTYKLYVTFLGPNGYNSQGKPYEIDVNYDSYVTNSILRFPYETLQGIGNLEDVIFYEIDGQTVTDVSSVRFFRDNFIFTDGMFGLYLDRAMATVSIPISQQFSTDLYQDDGIRDNFTEIEMKKSINGIVEMEKDVYHPVIWDSEKDEIKNEVYKIRFNLHFRAHRGDDWLAEADTYWNGVKVNGDSLELNEDYFVYAKKEQQSDLLTYLNFTDKDVRYQKNKLKKSFLRVMFFDSMNPANQNMLAYYTIFMDNGLYFSKYARFIETEGYKKISKDPDEAGNYKVKPGLNGIKVDREPTFTSKLVPIIPNTPNDDIEAVRLSSQLTVQDRYSSDSSSEGFYLYLWKDNFLGIVPQDIYMKVEFNHAGYGRTIPFMCPFKETENTNEGEEEQTEEKGFKSFQDIVDDWSDANKRYGIQKYLKYSYIHFKYKYDNVRKRHVYYLDDNFYGTDVENGGVHFGDNAITINLYEAKIV